MNSLTASVIDTRQAFEVKFESWLEEHSMHSIIEDGEGYVTALETFIDNDQYINEWNAEHDDVKLGHNAFSHMTFDQWRDTYFGFSMPADWMSDEIDLTLTAPTASSVDWSSKGAVTPVKDQGQCGSCWAFSTTGSVESATYLSTGKLPSLSEQELVDCAGFPNMGCNGGSMASAMSWISRNGGLCSESDYPYTSGDGSKGSCAKSSCSAAASVSGKTSVSASNEDALAAAVEQQPVSVAIEADQRAFQLYSSGVFTSSCGTNLDHGVLAVGFGTDGGQDYWKVKNSWGSSWGENGYIRLGRGSEFNSGSGQCGIAMQPVFPKV